MSSDSDSDVFEDHPLAPLPVSSSPRPPPPPKKPRKRCKKPLEDCFLKLQGRIGEDELIRFIRRVPCVLGRTGTRSDDAFVALGADASIAREHCELAFESKSGYYELRLMGKHSGVVVAGKEYPGEEGKIVRIKFMDPVTIGRAKFYVIPPDLERPKVAYSELCLECLEDAKRLAGGRDVSMSSKDMAFSVLKKYPFFNVQFGNRDKIAGLAKSFQTSIAKSERIVSIPRMANGRPTGKVVYQLGHKVVTIKTKGAEDSGSKEVGDALPILLPSSSTMQSTPSQLEEL